MSSNVSESANEGRRDPGPCDGVGIPGSATTSAVTVPAGNARWPRAADQDSQSSGDAGNLFRKRPTTSWQIFSALLLTASLLSIVFLGAQKSAAPIWPLLILSVVGLVGLSWYTISDIISAVYRDSEAGGLIILFAGITACALLAVAVLLGNSIQEKQKTAELAACGIIGFILGVNFHRVRSRKAL